MLLTHPSLVVQNLAIHSRESYYTIRNKKQMNSKQLLIKIFTLLYQETKQETVSELSRGLCARIIESIKLPEVTLGLDSERSILGNLVKTAKRVIDQIVDGGISVTELKQQFIIDCLDDTSTRLALDAGLVEGLEAKERDVMIKSIRRELHSYAREESCRALLKEYHAKASFHAEEISDMTAHIAELVGKLEPFITTAEQDDPALVARAVLSDDPNDTSVLDVYRDIKKTASGTRGFRTGFVHVNKMVAGVVDAGKLVTAAALQHNHKTGFTLALFRQFLMYNIPRPPFMEDEGKTQEELEQEEAERVYNPDDWVLYNDPYANRPVPVIAKGDPFGGKTPKRKPLAIRISAEDEITDNMQKLFEDIYFNVEGKAAVVSDFSDVEMTAYVKKHLLRNGWHAHFERINPSEWTYRNICQRVLDAEANGYDVKIFMLDYLGMIPTKGCETGAIGHDLRDMFRRVRNFMSARGILFITPHQLSSEAQRLERLGGEDLVKKFRTGAYYAGSVQIAQEIDLEFFMHIEWYNGIKYLTIQRGKFRSTRTGKIPEEHTYCALPFHAGGGGLQDDILKARPIGRAKMDNEFTAGAGGATADEPDYMAEFA